ncbi:nuclear transport factor 2 family protein [Nocardia asiatica]|uniref:nuclear transport factor 2 family protein n=1 Tax=Nocardia asiatica TaxID=209252 RepID=UPI0002E457E5|nr:nuclear transport factor 2 family protein [Nocardia asiatica]
MNHRDIDLWYELWHKECDYWADVDLNAGATAVNHYTEDAIFDIGTPGGRYVGRPAIAGFYERRRTGGVRTTAHLIHNFSLIGSTEQTAETRSHIVLYARQGPAPAPSGNPGVITAATTLYGFTAEKGWLITSRTNRVLFAKADQPTFPDPQPDS